MRRRAGRALLSFCLLAGIVSGLSLASQVRLVNLDQMTQRAARIFSVYGAIPTYQRILATGDATDPAEVCVVGTESQVRMRLEALGS